MISILRHDLSDVVYRLADDVASLEVHRDGVSKHVALWIDEPSTRNRVSVARACSDLNFKILDSSPSSGLSIAKGESLQDTFMVLSRYTDLFAIRTRVVSLPLRIYAWTGLPVLNLGDGWNEHPSQALSTLIAMHQSDIASDKATVAIYGDFDRSRTVRSVALGVASLGGTVILVDPAFVNAPRLASLPSELGLPGSISVAADISKVEADMLYVCRPQRERWNSSQASPPPLRVQEVARFKMVLHPLPRGEELSTDAWEFIREQALNHVTRSYLTRRALLAALMSGALASSDEERYQPNLPTNARCSADDCTFRDGCLATLRLASGTLCCSGCFAPCA
ncbi:hypothetical protein [Kribbella koreensis]|uniref:hypothetical protein n=1 Tax=Kribbella koreensis TaxID=57909 RepID=UPI003CD070E4